MKKLSATNASPLESSAQDHSHGEEGAGTGETRPVLFLDRAIDGHALATALRAAGANIRRHRDEFRADEDDAVWLTAVGQRGWFVLTQDARIRYNPLEIQALKAAVVGAFIFVPKNLTGPEIASIIAGALPAIEAAARRTPRPFIIKIYRDGSLRALNLDD